MAASMDPYEKWLTEKLLSLNPDTDTDVFVSYITGILEEDTPEEEKRESLIDFIGQVVEEDQDSVCDELFKKWEKIHGKMGQKEHKDNLEELTEHLSHILESQKIEVVKPTEKTAEEKARKEAILAQYAHVSSGEENDSDDGAGDAGQEDLGVKNVNAELVKKTEQEMREKSKLESEKKKEKDKQDREAQKEKQKERKEAEKKRTQKGERRR